MIHKDKARHLLALLPLMVCLLRGSACAAEAQPGPMTPDNLRSLSLEQLGRIEVTSQTKEPTEVWDTPAAISVLTQDDIRRSGATALPDLLRLIPGVDVAEVEGNQWAVGIRGLNSAFSKQILLLIDGRSTYTPLFEGVYWDVQDVMLDDIERIEIIRGPGGTVWGANAVNGVINIITKKAAETQGVLLKGGSGQVDRFMGAARVGLHHGSDFQYRLFAKGFVREDELNPHYDAYDRWHLEHGGFRAEWQRDARNSFTATGDLYRGASGQQVSVGMYAPLQQLVYDDNFTVSGGNVVATWQHRFDGGSDLHGHVSFDRTNRLGTEFGETRDNIDVDFVDHLTMLPREDVIWGAGMRFSPSNFIQTQPTVDFTNHQQLDSIYSAFVQDTFRIVPQRLQFTLGSKFTEDNYTGFEIQPNARLLWNIAPHSVFWSSISRAVRTPGRLDQDVQLTDVIAPIPPYLAHVSGNPNFKSEIQIGTEAGYRQLITSHLYMDVAAFHNQYDNLEGFGKRSVSTITTPITATELTIPYANAIKGVSDGVELTPDWKPTAWWELRGSFSHLHMNLRDKPGFTDASSGPMYTESSPHRMADAQSLLNLPHEVEFDVDYRFVSRLPAQNVESYQTMDTHISWKPCEQLRLSVAGRNLLQPHHHEFEGDDLNAVGIRRTVYASVTWTQAAK